jgi:hypothetical protein
MTDPNYWLAGWLALMALFFAFVAYKGFQLSESALGIFYASITNINLIAALYCVGFVVVMP